MNTREWIELIRSTLQALSDSLERLDRIEFSERQQEGAAIEASERWASLHAKELDLAVAELGDDIPEPPPEAEARYVGIVEQTGIGCEQVEIPEAKGWFPFVSPEGDGEDSFSEELTLREDIRRFAVALERWTRQKNW